MLHLYTKDGGMTNGGTGWRWYLVLLPFQCLYFKFHIQQINNGVSETRSGCVANAGGSVGFG